MSGITLSRLYLEMKFIVNPITNAAQAVGKAIGDAASAVGNAAVGAGKAIGKGVATAWNATVDFVVENKDAILTIAIALGSIALGVLTLGASGPAELAITSTIVGCAAIGSGLGILSTEAADFADNGKFDTPYCTYAG